MLSSPKLECYNNHEMLHNSVQLIIITFNGHKLFQFKNWKVDKRFIFFLKSETGGKVVAKFANRAPIANFLWPCQQTEITKNIRKGCCLLLLISIYLNSCTKLKVKLDSFEIELISKIVKIWLYCLHQTSIELTYKYSVKII